MVITNAPKNAVPAADSLALVHAGLRCVSGKGRERLKNLAIQLIAVQNNPGAPAPDSIRREIAGGPAGGPFPEAGGPA